MRYVSERSGLLGMDCELPGGPHMMLWCIAQCEYNRGSHNDLSKGPTGLVTVECEFEVLPEIGDLCVEVDLSKFGEVPGDGVYERSLT